MATLAVCELRAPSCMEISEVSSQATGARDHLQVEASRILSAILVSRVVSLGDGSRARDSLCFRICRPASLMKATTLTVEYMQPHALRRLLRKEAFPQPKLAIGAHDHSPF